MRTHNIRDFALAILLSSLAIAAGETTGRISGYVYDPTGQALAQVPLKVRGTALQQPQEVTTGDDGLFEFNNLPPGDDYEIEVKVEGFQPIKYTGINVNVGQATPVDIYLEVVTEQTPAAEYKIIEKVNPVLNPDSAESVSTINAEQAAQQPVFHQVEAMAQNAPGVSLANRPSTRGGLARWGKFYVDGLDTSDVTDGSITAPMNFDSVQSFEIITGGFDAQYNSLGMVENAVTKSGSNRFTYDLSLTLAPPFLVAKNQAASGQPDYTRNPINNPLPGPQTSFYSPIINLGGPIIEDRLWFYGSAQLNLSHKETSLLTPDSPMTENRPTDTTTRLARLKLTWAPTSSDRVSAAVHYDHNTIDNVLASPTVSKSAEERIDRGGYFLILNYDHNFTENILFQIQSGLTYKSVNTDPETPGISHKDQIMNFTRGSLGALSIDQQGNYLHENKTRYQFDPMLSVRSSDHQLKTGIQISYLQDAITTGVTDGVRYTDQRGVCDPSDPTSFGFCSTRDTFYGPNGTPELSTKASVLILGAFIQDRWTINRNVTVTPGFRVDWGNLKGDSGSVAKLVGWGPRLSGVWDVFGNRKSLVTAGYGRSNDVGNIFVAQHANQALTRVTSRFDPSTGTFPECDPAGPPSASCQSAGGPTGRSFASGQKPPYVDELTAGFHQEIAEETAAGIDFTYRYYGNMWADEEVNRIWDASGTQVAGYVDPSKGSQLVTQARGDAYRRYFGTDFWLQGTPGNWNLLGSYTLSWTYGTQGSDYFSDGYLTNPRTTQFYKGWSPDDRRHLVKAQLGYTTDFGLDVGVRVRFVTGDPLWERFNNPGDPSLSSYRSPRGTGFPSTNLNDPSTWTEFRNPSQFLVDLQARYNFGQLFDWTQRIDLVLLVVNLFNSTEATSLRDLYAAGATNTFGLVAARQAPFQAELLLRVRN